MKSKSILALAILAALALASCKIAPDPSWPPSPPPTLRTHTPWGDNWHRDGTF